MAYNKKVMFFFQKPENYYRQDFVRKIRAEKNGFEYLTLYEELLIESLNKDGVYYRDAESDGFIRPAEKLKIVSATGAGDSFSAAVLLGGVRGISTEETARMGMAAASVAMESDCAVNRDMNIKEILRRLAENV